MQPTNRSYVFPLSEMHAAFIARGYKNWKRVTTGFKTHEASECHREAIEIIELPGKCADIGEKLSASYHSEEKSKDWQIFLTILRNICFPAQQGFALMEALKKRALLFNY